MRIVLPCLIASVLAARPAHADAPPVTAAVVVPGGGGQRVLAAWSVPGELRLRTCEAEPCDASSEPARSIKLPEGVASPTLEPLAIGASRHALWAHAPGFDAIVAAAPASDEVKVLFAGPTGLGAGESGEQRGDRIEVTEPAADKTVRVLRGEVREDVSLCGRPTILSPTVLDPKELTWRGATVQRLSQAERDAAASLVAVRHAGPTPPPLARILRARAASSAVGSPAALTDGDPESTWGEARGGDGHGEFVQMEAPADVPIRSIGLSIRPASREVPHGAAPRRVWLATTDRLFAVRLPEDGWEHPGATYDVTFAEPLRSSCVALVLDEAYAKDHKGVDVTLAEVTARTELDGATDLAGLVGALAGGGERARTARSILERGGEPAFVATAAGYAGLDDAGRSLALEVMDNAPCAASAPVYVRALAKGFPGEAHHAKDRLRRCGRAAAPALAQAVLADDPKSRIAAAHELALAAPDAAVDAITTALPTVPAPVRVELRAALATATQSERATEALAKQLADANAPAVATIDLLRSLGDRADVRPQAAAALSRLFSLTADARTRYLLLAPAARLARTGDTGVERALAAAIGSDADAHVRARAAEVGGDVPSLVPVLVRALSDAEPRVRDAAVSSLGRALAAPAATPPDAVSTVATLLTSDAWTYVRAHAADTLGALAASGPIGDLLADGLGDRSPTVRARVVEALGRQHAIAHAIDVQARLEDESEALDVRARAARALGTMCDAKSIGELTSFVRGAAAAGADGPAQILGTAAAAALGRLHPDDLAARLAPLLGEKAPRLPREAAKAALDQAERCPR